MDKIFEQNIIEQDNILCKIEPEILEIILKYLIPNDVVHLSHTCKELHQKLPFYMRKSGIFTIYPFQKIYYRWFEGTAINFPIKEIKISFTLTSIWFLINRIALWMQIMRSEVVVFETQKYIIRDIKGNFQIKKSALKEYKHGDRLRFMAQNFSSTVIGANCSFQVAVQLENYEYGKPINTTEKVKGYPAFKRPFVSIDMENVSGPYHQPYLDLHSQFFGNYPEGNTNF